MKKKILFYTNIISPYRHKFFNQLSDHYDVAVVFRGEYYGGVPESWHDASSFSYKPFFLSKGVVNDRSLSFKGLPFLFHSHDYLFFTSYGYRTDLINILFAILLRKNYFLEFDGLIFKKDSFFKRKLKKLIFGKAKAIFSPSKASDDAIYAYCENAKIRRYPFTSIENKNRLQSLCTPEQKKALRSELELPEDKFIVLAVGQLIHRKGFDIFVDSSKLTDENVFYVGIGGIPTNESWAYKLDNAKNIVFKEFQNESVIKKFMMAADVFVFPTREDIWGLVVNEAMAYGLPVISTDKSVAALELIEDGVNGFIVPSESPEKIAEKINLLQKDSDLLSKLSINALTKSKEYTIENMVNVHIDFLSGTN